MTALLPLDQRRALGEPVGAEPDVAELLSRVDEGLTERLAVNLDRLPHDPRGRLFELSLETEPREERNENGRGDHDEAHHAEPRERLRPTERVVPVEHPPHAQVRRT